MERVVEREVRASKKLSKLWKKSKLPFRVVIVYHDFDSFYDKIVLSCKQ